MASPTILPEIALPEHGEFPNQVFVLKTDVGTHVIVNTQVQLDAGGPATLIHGLVAFTNEVDAEKRIQSIGGRHLSTQPVTFNEAREIALSKGQEVVAVILEENLKQKAVHYVR